MGQVLVYYINRSDNGLEVMRHDQFFKAAGILDKSKNVLTFWLDDIFFYHSIFWSKYVTLDVINWFDY